MNGLPNSYQRIFPDFGKTPKPVIAAIAMGFALLLEDEDLAKARQRIKQEWLILHQNGIVSQKPANAKAIQESIDESY